MRRVEDAGADALELNFGCPHGMSERGMGSSVGQVPDYTEMITSWVKEAAKMPVIVKLTPNVTGISRVALAAEKGGADAVSLINTVNSLIGVDLETFSPRPSGRKILAWRLLRACAEADRSAPTVQCGENVNIPIVGIGGIGYWNDAAEHIALARPCRKSAPRRCIMAFVLWRT